MNGTHNESFGLAGLHLHYKLAGYTRIVLICVPMTQHIDDADGVDGVDKKKKPQHPTGRPNRTASRD